MVRAPVNGWIAPSGGLCMIWLFMATGFMGAWTLWFLGRAALRKLGRIPHSAVFFSPKGGCQEAILKEINAARHEILVLAYSFTAEVLANGLISAKKRGVHVEVILDKSNEVERYSDLHIFLHNSLPPLIDSHHAIAHNKVMVIDKKTIITGSFNFTNQAEHENGENLLIIKGNPDLVQAYRQNYLAHKAHSRPAEQKPAADPKHLAAKKAA
jgi:phosphatidylserine/phosphatidylglycerophosphate/cardiolipin synthase-like enzyme